MMMDAEEEITWNLKGPKRMKKRRELNALIRNNVKYKSLLSKPSHNQSQATTFSRSDEFNMINCSSGRLLKGLNYSSTEDEEQRDYFFSTANKSIVKEKTRSHYCKIFQMILIGCFVTLFVLVAIVLVFSYAKFHDLLNELKRDVEVQNEQNRKSINGINKQMDNYDVMLKQLETKLKNFSENKLTETNKERSPVETNSQRAKRIARSIQSLDATNKMNTHLIKWLFNQSAAVSATPLLPYQRRYQKNLPSEDASKLSNILVSTHYKTLQSPNDIYQKVVDEFLKNNYDLAAILNISPNDGEFFENFVSGLEAYLNQIEQSLKYEILEEINASLTDLLDNCKCPHNSTAHP